MPRFLPFIQGGGGHVTGGEYAHADIVYSKSHRVLQVDLCAWTF